jgi:transcription initiation factor TFIIIB Brf1 subunit/transcription initiation factor TFIIB
VPFAIDCKDGLIGFCMMHHYTSMSPYDVEDKHCISCRTQTLFIDFSQGDTICRACGLVHSEKLIYDGPEWTDYNNEDGKEKAHVARAVSLVDESKWKGGGLEPTHLGKIFGPCSGQAEMYRKRLNKVKRNVDFYFEKQFENRIKESRMALKIKKRKADEMNHDSSLSLTASIVHDEQDHIEDDYTNLGTNEHDSIVKHENDQTSMLQHMLISQKWSLDRALLLHGTTHEIPILHHDDSNDHHSRHIDLERDILRKAMDSSQLRASEDLYLAYKIVDQSLRILKLGDNMDISKDIMDMMCKYASIKGSFQVRGVGSRHDKSSTVLKQQQEREFNKKKHIGSLACAFIFLHCKKKSLGRSLVDICSSFQCRDDSGNDKVNFIKAKHCSKALSEIRVFFPDYVQEASFATNKRVKTDSANSTDDICQSTVASNATSNVDNLIIHATRNLNLPPVALEAIQHAVNILQSRTSLEHVKQSVYLAVTTYMICQVGEIMQRLALQVSKKRSHNVEDPLLNEISRQVVTPEPEPFDVLSHSPTQNESVLRDSSWLEWKNQDSWECNLSDILTSYNVAKSTVVECYRKHLYPIRQEMLQDLKRRSSEGSQMQPVLSTLFVNIEAASSLLKTIPK